MMNYKRQKAFTLIELLVVVSIIALLVSILLPALGKAREQARRVVCVTQQRGLAISHILYAEDNNGDFFNVIGGTVLWNYPDYWPRDHTVFGSNEESWYQRQEPLTDGEYTTWETFYCPNFAKMTPYPIESEWAVHHISYVMFVNAFWSGHVQQLPTTDWGVPNAERRRDRLSNVKPSEALCQEIYVDLTEAVGTVSCHPGGSNVVFTDGRGEWVQSQDLTFEHSTTVHWYWPGIWWMYPDTM